MNFEITKVRATTNISNAPKHANNRVFPTSAVSIAVDYAENPITHREKCHYSKRAISDSIFCCDEGNPCQGRVKGVIHQMLLPVWMITLNPLVSAVDRLAAD